MTASRRQPMLDREFRADTQDRLTYLESLPVGAPAGGGGSGYLPLTGGTLTGDLELNSGSGSPNINWGDGNSGPHALRYLSSAGGTILDAQFAYRTTPQAFVWEDMNEDELMALGTGQGTYATELLVGDTRIRAKKGLAAGTAAVVIDKTSGGIGINMLSTRLVEIADASAGGDAVSRGFGDGRYLQVSGGTMSGGLDMNGNELQNLPDPTGNNQAVPRAYADGRYLRTDGSNNMKGNVISSVGTPTSSGHAATKGYVDGGFVPNSGTKTISGTTNHENRLNVNGSTYITSSVISWDNLYNSTDSAQPTLRVPSGSGRIFALQSTAAMKRDMEAIDPDEALSLVRRMRAIRFTPMSDDGTVGDHRCVGVTAEDMDKVLPEIVGRKDGKPATVAYDMLTAPLVAAVQALANQVDAIVARLDTDGRVAKSERTE